LTGRDQRGIDQAVLIPSTTMSATNGTHDAGDFERCTSRRPCPVCGAVQWCQRIGKDFVQCMRVSAGSIKSIEQSDGAVAHLHRLTDAGLPESLPSRPPSERADADLVHQVYTALLNALGLSLNSPRREALRRRGFTDAEINRLGYRDHPVGRERWRVAGTLYRRFGCAGLGVPGLIIRDRGNGPYPTLSGPGGLLVPVRDRDGRLVALKVRRDDADVAADPEGKNRYCYVTSRIRDWSGPKAVDALHVPLGTDLSRSVLRVTEGPIKADLCAVRTDVPTVAMPSAGAWKCAAELLATLPNVREVRLAPDADFRTNALVARGVRRLADAAMKLGKQVRLEVWDADKAKGIDDALAANVPLQVLEVDRSAETIHAAAAVGGNVNDERQVDGSDSLAAGGRRRGTSDRPEIFITTDEHVVIDQVIEALTHDPDLYYRGEELVRVIDDRVENKRLTSSGSPKIRPVPEANLRTRITSRCRLLQETKEDVVPVHPPKWLPAGVAAAAHWPGIRPITAVSEAPILRPNGTVLQTPGYDAETAVLYLPNAGFPRVPDRPTRDEAIQARDELMKIIADFPLASEAYRAAWLAAVLTPLARHAFAGPAPLFLADANIRGAGKGKLLDPVAIIATGRPFARATYVCDAVEMGKVITSVALSGEPLVLLDNISGKLGDGALDAALTSTETCNRLLGTNRTPRLPLTAVWYGTGNNVVIAADTARRTCYMRLDSPEENPENRDPETYRFPRLEEHVRSHRGRYLAAALTILSAYILAGRPRAKLRGWGSFESWSDLVRQAVVWVGMPDPDTRGTLAEDSDTDVRELRLLVAGWEEISGGAAVTVRSALAKFKDSPAAYPGFGECLAELFSPKKGEVPSPREIGYRLRKFARRVCGGKRLVSVLGHGNVTLWRTEALLAGTASVAPSALASGKGCDGGDADQSALAAGPTHQPTENVNGCDGGDGCHVSAHLHAGAHARACASDGPGENIATITTITTQPRPSGFDTGSTSGPQPDAERREVFEL
jgi:hypothetical protein